MTKNHAPVDCRWCGTRIPKPRTNQVYCKKQCRLDHKHSGKATNQKPVAHTSDCTECGNPFETDNPKKEFCSSTCQQDFNNFWKGQGPRLAKALRNWRIGRKPGSMSAVCQAFSGANKAHKHRKDEKKEKAK